MATTKRHDVKDLALAPEGVRRIRDEIGARVAELVTERKWDR